MPEVKRTWKLNGKEKSLSFPPMRRLLDVIREDLSLTGCKEGCGEGECGACTVLVNGETMCSCIIPAGQLADGTEILTVEGLEKTKKGKALQDAYLEAGAVQCGFCIPGMVLASYSLLSRDANPDEETIKKAHAGNICRCTGYVKIINAVKLAAKKWQKL